MLTKKILFTINPLKKLFRFTIPFDYLKKINFNQKKFILFKTVFELKHFITVPAKYNNFIIFFTCCWSFSVVVLISVGRRESYRLVLVTKYRFLVLRE